MFDDETAIRFTSLNVIRNERIPWDHMMNGDQDKFLSEGIMLSNGMHKFRVVKKPNGKMFAVVDENKPVEIVTTTPINTFDKRYKFVYTNELTGKNHDGDTIISDALEGIGFYMANENDSTSLYDVQDDDQPVFTNSVDDMAEYLNDMGVDYRTFDDEIRTVELR
ncbi:hypothetical protein [Weissella cibaria]|uniref:hypothetical protein n=1 Tax=Weissella cibaria TaxID=137591 RepID=UPI00223A749B|nr:hypothetical protein [Weissella cibaria]MCT0954926.1 hypothetical protein [Weissella cibaria]